MGSVLLWLSVLLPQPKPKGGGGGGGGGKDSTYTACETTGEI